MNDERVQCPNCKAIYEKPEGDLENYSCSVCGCPTLLPVPAASPSEQATLGVVGAGLGLLIGGVPGAIVGGIIGLLAGSEK
jgi:hypothetical protein